MNEFFFSNIKFVDQLEIPDLFPGLLIDHKWFDLSLACSFLKKWIHFFKKTTFSPLMNRMFRLWSSLPTTHNDTYYMFHFNILLHLFTEHPEAKLNSSKNEQQFMLIFERLTMESVSICASAEFSSLLDWFRRRVGVASCFDNEFLSNSTSYHSK